MMRYVQGAKDHGDGPDGCDSTGPPSKRAIRTMLAAGEARALGILQGESGHVANAQTIYECEGWLCDLQGECFQIRGDGKVIPYGEEKSVGHDLILRDDVGPADSVERKPAIRGLEIAIALGLSRWALVPSLVEAIVAKYGSQESVREELNQLNQEIRPEDRWRSTGREAFQKRYARQIELIAVERLLSPRRAIQLNPQQAAAASASTSAVGVQAGAHPGTRFARRAFFRRVGDQLATDAGVAIVGGSLGLLGLRAYTIRMASLQNKSDPDVQDQVIRMRAKEVWLSPDLYEVMERTSSSAPELKSYQSLFGELAQRGLQESWFVLDYEMLSRSATGDRLSRTVLVCRPGKLIDQACILWSIIQSRKGISRSSKNSKSVMDFTSIEAFHRLPTEWASLSFESVMKRLQEQNKRVDNPGESTLAPGGAPMSILDRSPDLVGDIVKP